MASLTERKVRQPNNLATLLGRLVSADADTGPVGTGHRVGPWITVFDQGLKELVDQVGVRTPVSTTLDKGEMIRIMILQIAKISQMIMMDPLPPNNSMLLRQEIKINTMIYPNLGYNEWIKIISNHSSAYFYLWVHKTI